MEIRLPLIKPEYESYVESTMISQLIINSRIGLIGLWGAILFYFAMLIYDAGFEKHRALILLQVGCMMLASIYLYGISNFIVKPRRLLGLAFVFTGIATATGGVSFFFQVPAIQNPNLRIAAFSFLVGVMGAAAFVFSRNRFFFPFFALLWLGPVMGHLLFMSGDFSLQVMGGMFFIMFAVLTFLSYIEYGRSLRLILSEIETKRSSEEIRQNLEEIQKLKTQQDGDYFLTSLLLKPLAKNHTAHEGAVSVEFYTRQYKQFEFRNRKSEIGGDLSCAHELILGGKECTVFLNADAMGKSIQGAGGALVMGIVFDSIIERTKQRQAYKKMYPERWLKSAFLELHKAFECFDGTMLVSSIFGVLEHETGVLYYLNLEHPWAVLYRDNRAEFIMQQHFYRKLGTTGLPGTIVIASMMLQAGDVVYLGSDGRDDLYIEEQTTKERIVNEDEQLFLRHIENGAGEIDRVVANIRDSGHIMDDLSLIKITYRGATRATTTTDAGSQLRRISAIAQDWNAGDMQAAQAGLRDMAELEIRNRKYLKALIKLSIKCRESQAGLAFAEQYLSIDPLDDMVLYAASLLHTRLGNLEQAADLAERLRLRGRSERKYIDHLAKIYQRIGNEERSSELLKEYAAG